MDQDIYQSSPGGNPAKILTIAGSDSGGAAGLQADLKTLTALRTYGMSVVTAVTAQNSLSVDAVHFIPAQHVADQIDSVLSDYGAGAAKTGFIGQAELITAIAARLRYYAQPNLVIDPVLVDHQGQAMFAAEVPRAYVAQLLPLADLITPNVFEAALLADAPLPLKIEVAWLRMIARRLHQFGPKNVLIKGGRFGDESVDLWFNGRQFTKIASPWIETQNTHGSGDTLSAAICAFLAQGVSMPQAILKAHHFTHQAIRAAVSWQLGGGHGPLSHY